MKFCIFEYNKVSFWAIYLADVGVSSLREADIQ